MSFDPLLLGHRTTRWSADVLDLHTGEILAPMRGVTGGSVDLAYDSRLKASGKLDLIDLGQGYEWQHILLTLRVEMTARGRTTGWRVGTFRPSFDETERSTRGSSRGLELSSVLSFLEGDVTIDTFVVPAGSSVKATIESILAGIGSFAIPVIAETDTITQTDMVWPSGEDWLTIVNRLLEATGYLVAQPDRGGGPGIEMRPLVPPHLRPVQDTLGPDDARVVVSDANVVEKRDELSVPNRVVSRAQGAGDEEALVGVAVNRDPTSPYAYIEGDPRSYWRSRTIEGVQADTQDAIDSNALSNLISLSNPSHTVVLETLPIPVAPYDAIALKNLRGATDGRYVIDRMSYTLSPTGTVKETLRKVVEYSIEGA